MERMAEKGGRGLGVLWEWKGTWTGLGRVLWDEIS